MAQLWGGRFTKETDQLVYNFNASISFDQKFYKQDIEGSIAHVRMLGKQGILTQEEMQAIVSCLQEILADVESGKLASDKFCNIRIFLLWHDTASGTVGIVNLHKPIFVGIPDDHFL